MRTFLVFHFQFVAVFDASLKTIPRIQTDQSILLFAACRRGELLPLWVPENNRPHIRVPDADDVFRCRDYFQTLSFSNSEMGC